MAGKRPLCANGAEGLVQYPVFPKRPKFDDINSQHQDKANWLASSEEGSEDGSTDGDESSEEGDASPANPVPKWQLSSQDVPPEAKKIYCVRRGHQPGFYFDYAGSNGAEAQVRGFQDNLFMSFPQGKKVIKASTQGQVIASAVEYMNHNSQSCKYNCGGKCATDQSVPRKQQSETSKAEGPSLCRECQTQPPRQIPGEAWRICHSCWISSGVQTAIHRSSQKLQLCEEQTRILELVAKGQNVFFTGAAGTGKSRVLEAVVDYSKRRILTPRVVAPTGMAAINVFGTTLHMFAGWTVKLAKGSKAELKKLAHEKKVWKRFKETDILVIDEISMVESDTLSRLSLMMQEAFQIAKPFGGVQVVISGDFYQLPPVRPFETCIECGDQLEGWEQQKEVYTCHRHGTYRDEDKWSFRSPVWEDCDFANVRLVQVHRQADAELMAILDSMRNGVGLTGDQATLLLDHKHNIIFDEAVKLGPLRQEVDNINDAHMKKLLTPPRTYRCIDDLHWTQRHQEFLDPTQPDGMSKAPFACLLNHRYAADLELKEGMQVLLIHNLDIKAGLVNGTSGKVIGFEAMTAEKLPRAKRGSKDSSKVGEELISHEHRQYVEKRIHEFYQQAHSRLWPIVKFNVSGGKTLERTVHPQCSLTELGREEPYSLLSRTQIPLCAGWAITVHKSQGLTLTNVAMSLDKCFAAGQAYVALSRVRSLSDMIVQTLPASDKLRSGDAVREFMRKTFGV